MQHFHAHTFSLLVDTSIIPLTQLSLSKFCEHHTSKHSLKIWEKDMLNSNQIDQFKEKINGKEEGGSFIEQRIFPCYDEWAGGID